MGKNLTTIFLAGLLLLSGLPCAWGGNWQENFDHLCGLTDQAETMSVVELRETVKQCDALLAVIDRIDHPQKKIYLFRLRKCRNLFAYMVEVREQTGGHD